MEDGIHRVIANRWIANCWLQFIGDIAALIRPTMQYDQTAAFEVVKTELLEKMDLTKRVKKKE